MLSVQTAWASGWDGLTIESPKNISKKGEHSYFVSICSYSTGKSPGHASRCHEVIQAQCLDDDTEQAQLLGVLRDIVSAVKSATAAGLRTQYLYSVTVAVHAKCSDSLSLWMRSNPPKIFLKRGNTHTLFQILKYLEFCHWTNKTLSNR